MNRDKAQEAINQIVAKYRASAYKGGRKQYPASKKYLAQAEELGILDMIPNAYGEQQPGNDEIRLILAAATDAGHQVGGLTAEGEGDYLTTAPSALYLAINEQPKSPVTVTFEVRVNTGLNHIWSLAHNEDDLMSIVSNAGPADVTVTLTPGDYVEIVREQNPTHGDIVETVIPITITEDGRIVRHDVPGSIPFSELI